MKPRVSAGKAEQWAVHAHRGLMSHQQKNGSPEREKNFLGSKENRGLRLSSSGALTPSLELPVAQVVPVGPQGMDVWEGTVQRPI